LHCGEEILGRLPVRDIDELEFGIRRDGLVQVGVDVARL
jgi:hypothetical protein